MNTIHCSDCSAPIHTINQTVCEYCGNAFTVNPVGPSPMERQKIQSAMAALQTYPYRTGGFVGSYAAMIAGVELLMRK